MSHESTGAFLHALTRYVNDVPTNHNQNVDYWILRLRFGDLRKDQSGLERCESAQTLLQRRLDSLGSAHELPRDRPR